MRYSDKTDIGGMRDAFLTTHWSLIEGIHSDNKNHALIDSLLGLYWKPVYCYLRQKHYGNEEAKDLTQGFFHEIVINRNLVQRADRAKGRFRTFLLHALNQYLINEHKKQRAHKRHPKGGIVSLDWDNPPSLPQEISQATPEDSYNYVWMSSLLDQALNEVKTYYADQGKALHWQVFSMRIVQPTLENARPPSLHDIAQDFGIESEQKVTNMIVTVKRFFRKTLIHQLRITVLTHKDAEGELGEIMSLFSS
jgi:DNA-directed RNA polymerase specialized sigma24 family protein